MGDRKAHRRNRDESKNEVDCYQSDHLLDKIINLILAERAPSPIALATATLAPIRRLSSVVNSSLCSGSAVAAGAGPGVTGDGTSSTRFWEAKTPTKS